VRREQRNDSLKTLVGFLDHGVLETFAKIKGVTKDTVLTDTGCQDGFLCAQGHRAAGSDRLFKR
jgi:hypothetical protein